MSAAVAATCAKIGFVFVDGRYRTLMPAVVGFLYHASVRLEFHVGASERVSISRSLGDMTSVLQLRDACVSCSERHNVYEHSSRARHGVLYPHDCLEVCQRVAEPFEERFHVHRCDFCCLEMEMESSARTVSCRS